MLWFGKKKGEDKSPAQTKHRGSSGLLQSGAVGGQVFRKSIVFLLTAAVVFVAVFVLFRTVTIFLLLFAGILLSIVFTSAGGLLERRLRFPRKPAVTAAIALFAVLIVLLFVFTAPRIAEQFGRLSEAITDAYERLTEWLEARRWGSIVIDRLSSIRDGIGGSPETVSQIAGAFSTTFGAIGSLFLVLLVAVYLAFDPDQYVNGALRLVPPERRGRAAEIFREIGTSLRWWLLTQLFSMTFLAVTTWSLLLVLGVPLAFTLALLTGILTFVPYLGPLLALVPIMLLSFLNSPATALYAFVLFQVVQTVEGSILLPILYRRTVHVSPVLTILSQLLFGTLFGLPGVLLATPLMVTATVAVRMLYVEDVLGDRSA